MVVDPRCWKRALTVMETQFAFVPTSPLPLDEIHAHLASLWTVRRDVRDPDTYMVADDPRTLVRAVERRANEPEGFPYSVVLVDVHPARLLFAVMTMESHTARAFAKWLLARYPVSVQDERFTDITAQCDANLDRLFGAPRKTRLHRLGFFQELPHGHVDGPSLVDRRRPKGSRGARRVAVYLRTAPILVHALGPVADFFDPAGGPACAPNIRSDGMYVWPEDLAIYVVRYHVALPSHFTTLVRMLGFTPPREIHGELLEW